MSNPRIESKESSLVTKAMITGSVYALIICVILFFKATFSVLLLVLASALIAIFFRGLSDLLQRKTHWKQSICLTVSISGTVVFIVGLLWLIGSEIQNQVMELTRDVPEMVENAKRKISDYSLGRTLMEKASSPSSVKRMEAIGREMFTSTFGIVGDLYVVLFISVFFTVSPQTYKNGLVQLVPANGKNEANQIIDELGNTLKKWLKGKLIAMAVVMVLTSIGLAILGLPMWLVLAIIAGLLNFIPNFGPLIAMIPAVLVGLMQSPTTAAIIVAMYTGIQIIESNFITPLVQQRLVSIPPALIIIAQLLISPLTGAWGLLLATPLMLIVMVLVQRLYVKRQSKL